LVFKGGPYGSVNDDFQPPVTWKEV